MATTGRSRRKDDKVMKGCWRHHGGKNSDDVLNGDVRHGGKMVTALRLDDDVIDMEERKYHPLGNLGVHILTP
jgi:hypothetical protein